MEFITLTANLLAEWTLDIGQLQAGTTHRAKAISFQVGGKGINVSRVLNQLQVSSTAICFADGPMGELCSEWLQREQIRHQIFPLGQAVRPGFVIRPAQTEAETTFLGSDNPVPPTSWQAALREVAEHQPAWLAICGSIPGWQTEWAHALQPLIDSGTRVCADTYGTPLPDLARYPLELIKINRQELIRSWPKLADLSTPEALRRLRSGSPVGHWVVTDGPGTVYAVRKEGPITGLQPAAVRQVSPTGCGDTLLAVLIARWRNGEAFEEALSEALACATASAAQTGIGGFPLPPLESCRPVPIASEGL